MSEDSMLKCLIAFILGWLASRMMGNGFSVGGQAGNHNNDDYTYLYTFHPDPIYNIEQLGNRNYSSALSMVLSNDNTMNVNPCVPYAKDMIFKKSYNYFTRIKVNKDSLTLSDDYEEATDCACKVLKNPIGKAEVNVDHLAEELGKKISNHYNLQWPHHIKGVNIESYKIYWYSLNKDWVKENVKTFDTIYTKNQDWNEINKIDYTEDAGTTDKSTIINNYHKLLDDNINKKIMDAKNNKNDIYKYVTSNNSHEFTNNCKEGTENNLPCKCPCVGNKDNCTKYTNKYDEYDEYEYDDDDDNDDDNNNDDKYEYDKY